MIIDHKTSLVNLSNSILKTYGIETYHQSIKDFDDILKNHKKICVMLFDGMGKNIIHKHLPKNSFIRQNYFKTIYSTTPPTTAAATTSFLTGKFPIETGWLGWSTYFPEYDRNIILFRGVDYNTEEEIVKDNPRSIAINKFPTKSIMDLIYERHSIKTYDLKKYPICFDGPKTLKGARKQLYTILHKEEQTFIYFYWDNPDYTMHATGINSKKTHEAVKKVNDFVKTVVLENPDTLFLTIADHGHINTKYIDISLDEDLMSCLCKPCSLEKRCTSFFVKNECIEKFKNAFNKYKKFFDLLSKEEVLKIKFFGEGESNNDIIDSFGDFIAISKSDKALIATKEFKNPEFYPGHHAGGTKEEMEIDVSVFNR